MREQIKQIIIEEFSRVVNLIENDFKSNYDRKVNNISKVVSKISRPTKGRLLYYSIFGGNFG